ncbi:MAG: carboxypeptidase-like regulatory domain-containing protein [Paludibacter sp.]|nr:carboxypeptidase-like regulatory domain-containing protein [Paludibacter sp.]
MRRMYELQVLKIIIIFLLLDCYTLFAQNVSGIVFDEKTKLPVEYVNIGVVEKNTGTVSDLSGYYSLFIDSCFDNNILLFSSIGYYPFSIKVADLKAKADKNIYLKPKSYEISEVIVRPKVYKERTLGVTSRNKKVAAGFENNLPGYELGILMHCKKSVFIKKVIINIANCTYDSVFYRLNIYKVRGKMNFENVLVSPIYFHRSKLETNKEIQLNLESQNIVVDGDFLVTLEHVKDLGKGSLNFCIGLFEKTYYRKTSQGDWKTIPIGVSISVEADVEK